MSKSKNTTTYKTKNIDGRLHIQCQNSDSDSKYYQGEPCDKWVPFSDKTNVVSVLCSNCTSHMCSTPQTKKKVKAPGRKSVSASIKPKRSRSVKVS